MSKRLITDRDVLEGRVVSPVRLDGNTIVTPSALDRMCRLGIVVLDGREGRAPASSMGPGGAPGTAGGAGRCPQCGEASCPRNADGRCERCCAGPGGAAGAAAPAGSTAWNELADGTYLVRVRGGRVVSLLTATGPGRMVRAGGV